MVFENNEIYHIYNQGNNRQLIFFGRNNYLFFIEKIKTYILPYADILAWCLMPNHFHLMVYVKDVEINSRSTTQSRATTINKSIGILLTSYTRAINIQENRSGSLFKPHTKAECITKSKGITPAFINTAAGARIFTTIPEKEYPQNCFNYIHENPVKAHLVKLPENWEFSSFRDYCGLRKESLINRNRAEEFGLYIPITYIK